MAVAGVVDENIDRAEPALCTSDLGGHGVEIGYIEHQRVSPARRKRLMRRRGLFVANGADHHVAGLQGGGSEGLSQTGTYPGNQKRLSRSGHG